MNRLFFDTCFLIDLERELIRGTGKVHAFLAQHALALPCLTWTVAGEFGEGFGDLHHPACAAMLSRFQILPMKEATAHHYAATSRMLRQSGQLIGSNDLWIDAASLAHGLPLVTHHTARFSRVPGLAVVGY